MLLPALSKAKAKAQGIQCMNNHRQLALAWRLYADDSEDWVTFASTGGASARGGGSTQMNTVNPNDPNNFACRVPTWMLLTPAIGRLGIQPMT